MISSQYQKRVHSLQKHMLALQLFLIAIGGAIFGISVEVRNILRLTKPEFHITVRGFLELMLISGIVQIVSAGYSCFTACWKLLLPMRIAIAATVVLILGQLAAIITVFYLMSEGHRMVSEEVYVHWYEWECAELGSCHNAFANYVNYYMLPQVLILAVAIFLQGLSIIYLWRFMAAMTEKQLRITRSRDLLHNPDNSTVSFGFGLNETAIVGGAGRSKLRQQRESVDSIDFITDLLRMRKTSASDASNSTAGPGSKTPITSTMVINTHTQAEVHHFEIDDATHGQQERRRTTTVEFDIPNATPTRVKAAATICTDLGGNRFFCSGGTDASPKRTPDANNNDAGNSDEK